MVLWTDGEFVSRDDGAAGVAAGEGDEGGWDIGDEDLELPDVVCLLSYNSLSYNLLNCFRYLLYTIF